MCFSFASRSILRSFPYTDLLHNLLVIRLCPLKNRTDSPLHAVNDTGHANWIKLESFAQTISISVSAPLTTLSLSERVFTLALGDSHSHSDVVYFTGTLFTLTRIEFAGQGLGRKWLVSWRFLIYVFYAARINLSMPQFTQVRGTLLVLTTGSRLRRDHHTHNYMRRSATGMMIKNSCPSSKSPKHQRPRLLKSFNTSNGSWWSM